jgi:O-antigen ligase
MTFASALLLAVFLVVVPNPIYKGLTRTEETAYGRWPLAKIAATMISHHPLFGIGLNNFTHASRQYDFTPEQISAAWNSPVHNLFLFIAGEIGLVGLTCFLIFILRVVTALTPALRSLDPFILSVGTGLIFSLMAFFIHAQVDYSIWTQNRPFWLLLGLSVSVGRFAKSAPLVASPGLP